MCGPQTDTQWVTNSESLDYMYPNESRTLVTHDTQWITNSVLDYMYLHVITIDVCAMTNALQWWRYFSSSATWLRHICDNLVIYCPWRMYHDSFVTLATWLIVMCDVTHSHVRRETDIYMSMTCGRRILYWVMANTMTINYNCDMTHSHLQRDSDISATRPYYVCGMTHSLHVWRDSFSSATWLRHIYIFWWHVVNICSIPYVPWLIHHNDDVTHSHVRRDSDIFTTRLYYVCAMTHSLHVWRDSCLYATWLRQKYDTALLCVYHDPFITTATWLVSFKTWL